LWRRLSENDRRPLLGAYTGSAVDDPWMKPLLGNPPLAFPPWIAALAFAGGYLALLVPLLTAGLSRRLGGRLRAALLMCVVAAAWCAGWLIFNHELFGPGARVFTAARVDMTSGDGMARVTEKIGLFGVRAGSAHLSLGAGDVVVDEPVRMSIPTRAGSAPNPGFDVDDGQETIIGGLSFGRFGSRLLVLDSVIPMHLEARVSGGEPSFTLVASNGSERPLRSCFLVHAGRGYRVGDIAPFETATRTFATGEGLSMSNPAARLRIAGDVSHASFLDQSGAEVGKGSNFFAGWMDGPVIAHVQVHRPALCLVVVEAK
jgi:hypothetical protein